MTSEELNLLLQTDDPLAENAFPQELSQEWAEHRERMRKVCVAEYSSSPYGKLERPKTLNTGTTFP